MKQQRNLQDEVGGMFGRPRGRIGQAITNYNTSVPVLSSQMQAAYEANVQKNMPIVDPYGYTSQGYYWGLMPAFVAGEASGIPQVMSPGSNISAVQTDALAQRAGNPGITSGESVGGTAAY